MSNRLQQRKYGREVGNSAAFEETPYVIKIGFNKVSSGKDERGEEGEKEQRGKTAGKLPGFLLCHNSKAVGAAGYAPAYDEMELLGYSKEKIERAFKLELKAEPAALLPLALRVVIPRDAKRVGEGKLARWEYPGTFVEEFQLWTKNGLACHGDGMTATRRKPDFTTTTIDCKPIGTDVDANCCPFSVKKDCKCKSRWIFTPFYVDKNGIEQPISRSLGWQAAAKLDTTSDYAQLAILEELDRAADFLNGNIRGLTGTLFFGVHEKRHSKGSVVGKVGQVRLRLDQDQIDRRASGESERISAAIVSAPSRVESLPTPEPATDPLATSAPADDPAPNEPERATDTPPVMDAFAMSDEELLETLGAYVASRSGSSPDAAKEIVWFNMNGNRKCPPLDWFLSDEPNAQKIGRARLREICAREFQADEFKAWAEEHAREGAAS